MLMGLIDMIQGADSGRKSEQLRKRFFQLST